MTVGIIAAVALCALAANIWLGYAIEDQGIIKGGLALGCVGACGVYWLAVGMFRLRGAGSPRRALGRASDSGGYMRRYVMGYRGERRDSVE